MEGEREEKSGEGMDAPGAGIPQNFWARTATAFSRGILKFQYWEVASSCPVGMGLLMGCGTWALWHCPLPEKFLIFLLK
jgi:hypothetical protein